jgi:hypothetical protein
MPTHKKAVTTEVDAPPATQNGNGKVHKEELTDLTLGVMTDAGFVPKGIEQVVDCDVYPEVPLRVHYLANVAWRAIRSDYELPGATPAERQCRKVAFVVRKFDGWNFADPFTRQPIPEPDPADWRTYMPMMASGNILNALGRWVIGPGLNKALDQASGN